MQGPGCYAAARHALTQVKATLASSPGGCSACVGVLDCLVAHANAATRPTRHALRRQFGHTSRFLHAQPPPHTRAHEHAGAGLACWPRACLGGWATALACGSKVAKNSPRGPRRCLKRCLMRMHCDSLHCCFRAIPRGGRSAYEVLGSCLVACSTSVLAAKSPTGLELSHLKKNAFERNKNRKAHPTKAGSVLRAPVEAV